ncbi:MAG: EBSC protein [Firmicutes bacterium]|nr:EBSC protein [Bacillota bacterium]MDI6704980.1 YbaK/EbsC family protein [Bacillota bacterium]
MNRFEERLQEFMDRNGVEAEHLVFEESCHSVEEAAAAANAAPEDFVKSICMIDDQERLIVAIVKGEDRASTSRVAKALNIETLRTATPQEILEKTGYVCGGVPSFGYEAVFLIDPKVMEKDAVYTGGGSENSLVRISPAEMQRINGGMIVKVRK